MQCTTTHSATETQRVRLGTHSQRRSNQRRAAPSWCGALGLYWAVFASSQLLWEPNTNPMGRRNSTTGQHDATAHRSSVCPHPDAFSVKHPEKLRLFTPTFFTLLPGCRGCRALLQQPCFSHQEAQVATCSSTCIKLLFVPPFLSFFLLSLAQDSSQLWVTEQLHVGITKVYPFTAYLVAHKNMKRVRETEWCWFNLSFKGHAHCSFLFHEAPRWCSNDVNLRIFVFFPSCMKRRFCVPFPSRGIPRAL